MATDRELLRIIRFPDLDLGDIIGAESVLGQGVAEIQCIVVIVVRALQEIFLATDNDLEIGNEIGGNHTACHSVSTQYNQIKKKTVTECATKTKIFHSED